MRDVLNILSSLALVIAYLPCDVCGGGRRVGANMTEVAILLYGSRQLVLSSLIFLSHFYSGDCDYGEGLLSNADSSSSYFSSPLAIVVDLMLRLHFPPWCCNQVVDRFYFLFVEDYSEVFSLEG